MGLLLMTVGALCVWIVLWSLGVPALDGFGLVPGAVLVALIARAARAAVGGSRRVLRGSPCGGSGGRGARGRLGFLVRTWVIGVFIAAAGLGLWVAALVTTDDSSARLGELGAGLLSGAVVAFAVFLLERQFDRRSELESMRKTIGLQRDLSDVDLGGEDLSGFSFQGKDLTDAELSGATLRGARFGRATLRRTVLVGADLTRAVFSGATLDGAQFAGADLTGAIFTEARGVASADFVSATFRGDPPVFSGQMPAGIRDTGG